MPYRVPTLGDPPFLVKSKTERTEIHFSFRDDLGPIRECWGKNRDSAKSKNAEHIHRHVGFYLTFFVKRKPVSTRSLPALTYPI